MIMRLFGQLIVANDYDRNVLSCIPETWTPR